MKLINFLHSTQLNEIVQVHLFINNTIIVTYIRIPFLFPPSFEQQTNSQEIVELVTKFYCQSSSQEHPTYPLRDSRLTLLHSISHRELASL